MSTNPDLPPLPRDHARSNFSEIVPISSAKINIFKSSFLIPGIATVVATLYAFDALFASFEDTTDASYRLFAYGIGTYLIFMMTWLIWSYSGSRKPFWALLVPALAVYLTLDTIAFALVALLFREVLPGNLDDSVSVAQLGFANVFTAMFFGAGLCEEIYKQFPTILAVLVGGYLAKRPGQSGGVIGALSVRTPLDGLLFGVAAGAGFIANESFGQYYDVMYGEVFNATGDSSLASLYALMLTIPRSLQSLAGHMGWSGIFGYFIGLAAARRSSALPVFLVGWILAAALHGIWNSQDALPSFAGYVISAVTFLIFVACLLKARQLEPVLTGAAMASGGSILVGESLPRSALVPGTSARRIDRALAVAQPGSPLARVSQNVAAGAGAGGWLSAPAGPAPAGAGRAPFRLRLGDLSILLRPGSGFDCRNDPDLPGGSAVAGETATHPNDPAVIGLKNLSAETWTVVTPAGETQSVPPQRNVRLAPGLLIRFGAVEGRVEARA